MGFITLEPPVRLPHRLSAAHIPALQDVPAIQTDWSSSYLRFMDRMRSESALDGIRKSLNDHSITSLET